MIEGRRSLVTAADAAHWIRTTYGAQVRPDRIRQWAARKLIARHPACGRARFDLHEVVAYARSKGLIGP